MKRTLREFKGITLIALVITIVVLLILAGVSIAMLTGENGILTQATNAKAQTAKGQFEEEVDLALLEWRTNKEADKNYTTSLVDFLKTKPEFADAIITENGDGTITIEKDGYEITVSADGERLTDAEKAGMRPEIETKLYQTNGSEVQEGQTYSELIITVKIANEENFNNIEIKVTKANGEEITAEGSVIGEGRASYKITENGKYKVEVKATGTDGSESTGVTEVEVSGKFQVEDFNRNLTEGKIEVVWLDENNNIISNPKEPNLKGNMQPIKLNAAGNDFETTDKGNWGYNYANSQWANAQTTDGSMWVWIPRYAYKITYYGTDGSTIVGYSNANGLVNANGEVIETNGEEIKTVGDYIVHPAFTASEEAGGGFGEISGFWMGKFEATGTRNTSDYNNSTVSVKPGETSLITMTINQQYHSALNAKYGETENLGSHMAKNSEWGAVAYLAHSKYGTNGQKIEKNISSSYYTGGSSDKVTIYTTNAQQSTTHNATGVYDMNGGAYEYVATYVNNGDSNLTTCGGGQTGDLYEGTESASTKYRTIYENKGSQSSNYEAAKSFKGDAIYETSNTHSSDTGSWFDAYAYFPYSSNPFFKRSGNYYYSNAGTFYFLDHNGGAHSRSSFRPVLAF